MKTPISTENGRYFVQKLTENETKISDFKTKMTIFEPKIILYVKNRHPNFRPKSAKNDHSKMI